MRQNDQLLWLAAALSAVAAVGCGEQLAPEPGGAAGVAQSGRPALESSAGIQVSETRMRDLLAELTRDAALAIGNSAVRRAVYESLHASAYPEHKLHFRTFLQAGNRALLAGMADARKSDETSVLATLDSVVDLEFYMPVPAHFRDWTGGSKLLVGSALYDDDTPPTAYDLAGKEVKLSSAKVPPSTPTLALVPVETDFSAASSRSAPPQPATETEQPGVYMVYSVVYDNHEGFLRGVPEFEVHTFVQDPYGTFVDRQCSGAQRNGALYYDQNNEAWWGRVLLVLQGGIEGDSVQYQLWEDDTDPCTETSGRPPKTTSATKNQIASYYARYVGIVYGSPLILQLVQGAALLIDIATASIHDDFVGFIGAEGPGAGCWNSSGPSNFGITNLQGNSEGYAALDWTFGTRNPICGPGAEPLPNGSVRILGPTLVRPNTSCNFSSSVTAGTSPYTYQWFDGTSTIGTDPYVVASTGTAPFYLTLQVSDANGRGGSETLLVNVDESAPICPQ